MPAIFREEYLQAYSTWRHAEQVWIRLLKGLLFCYLCSDTLMLPPRTCRPLTMSVSSVVRKWSPEQRNCRVTTFSTPGKLLSTSRSFTLTVLHCLPPGWFQPDPDTFNLTAPQIVWVGAFPTLHSWASHRTRYTSDWMTSVFEYSKAEKCEEVNLGYKNHALQESIDRK